MRIDDAEIKDGKLVLSGDMREARRWLYGFTAGDYEIKRARAKRSLDANAYAWVLIDKLAGALRLTKEAVYKEAIRNVGDNLEVLCIKTDAVPRFKAVWEAGSLGRQIIAEPSKIDGFSRVRAYYGSSEFDSRQMSLLIDNLIQDCKAMEIETLPPDKIAALLEAWQ